MNIEAAARLWHLLSTLQERCCHRHMQDSLPAGWLAFAVRELNPMDRDERFPNPTSLPPFLDLSLTLLDNHSAHISKETRAWLDTRPVGRFEFTFTPKHGSWLNLIEGFFSKFARSVLRHIRVASKYELKERIMAGIDDVNRHPVIHTWSYKLAEAA
jgi:DDE superfamily endonuclease